MKGKKASAYRTVLSIFFILMTPALLAQTVEITNGVTKKMTKYKYFFIRYEPSVFKITVNGKTIEQGETEKIDVKDGKLEVRYDYEFGKHRKGAKVVTFDVPKEKESIKITFGWKKKNRILIKGLKALSVTRIEV